MDRMSSRLGFLLVALPAVLAAQSTFGTILGTVNDKSGAVVPSAQVTITNQAENTSRTVAANAEGNFEALNLKAGAYTVSAEAKGFKTYRVTDLELAARQTLRVNVTLEVGQLTEAVTVEGATTVINTETQTISATFTTTQVLELPANFRGAGSTSPLRLVAFLPGVQADDGMGYSVQGALPVQNEVSLDGISAINADNASPLSEVFPSAEGIAEMKVQGVGSNAEFGQVGDVTATSRGGGNSFHGSLFEYMQNRVFDATAYGSTIKPQKTANTFGGSLSGPVFKNRTFFFVTFEDMQYRRGTAIQNTVPTALMRDGDFSKETGTVRNPLTGQPYPGNRIPAADLNPVAKKLLPYYQLPNFGPTDVQRSANFRENRAAPITSAQYDIRIDHTLTARQSLFSRWSYKNMDATSPNRFVLPADTSYAHSRSFVVSHNYTISPTVLNEFRLGFTNYDGGTSYAFDGRQITGDLGLQGLPPLTFNGLPSFNFSGGTTSFGKGKPGFTTSRNLQTNNNLTWVRGRHAIKAGADLRRLRAKTNLGFIGSDNYGNFSFDGRYSGKDFADFMLGIPYHSAFAYVRMDNDGLALHYSFYVQDSFKLSPKLTLEYGLRWEYHPPYTDASGDITNFDRAVPVTGRVVIPSSSMAREIAAPGFLLSINACPATAWNAIPCTPFLTAKEAGWPETLRFSDKKDFNPRFGFAYRPFADTRTVVRGGFGVYTQTILGSVYYSLTGIHSSDVREFTNDIQGGRPLFRLPQISTTGTGITTVPYGKAYFGTANDPRFADPYELQWSLTLERDLGWDTGLRLSYVGLRSIKLAWSPDLNQPQTSTTPYAQRPLTDRPFPYWGRVYTRDTGANAIYNALQTQFTHRVRGGLTFDSAWTWAKNLADSGGPAPTGFTGGAGGGRVTNSLDRRADRGNVAPTRRHRWITTAIYELPFGKGRKFLSGANPVVHGLAGGWRLSAIALMQTGPYLTATFSGGDPSGTGGDARGSQRPDAVRNANLPDPTADRYFDREAFVCPGRVPGAANQFNCSVGAIGRFGNAGVGTLVGPGTVNLSMGLGKDFRLREWGTLKFEASFTNLPNHPNLANPGAAITSIAFGRSTSARGGDSGGNRIGQFALRLEF